MKITVKTTAAAPIEQIPRTWTMPDDIKQRTPRRTTGAQGLRLSICGSAARSRSGLWRKTGGRLRFRRDVHPGGPACGRLRVECLARSTGA